MNNATFHLITEVMEDEVSTETPQCQHRGCESSSIQCDYIGKINYFCHAHAITHGYCTCCGEYVAASQDHPFCTSCNELAV